ncbi:MAG: hypothetical protein MJZ12_08205 [Prevotella sp.]|nr:hypothetical protein [Prevotella sp.]
MAGLGFIGKFFVKRRLRNWKNRSHKRVFSENAEWAEAIGRKSFYIHRTYNYNSVCVDLYWYIKPSKTEKHVDYLYTRCAWESVKEAIKEYETVRLPKVIADSSLI